MFKKYDIVGVVDRQSEGIISKIIDSKLVVVQFGAYGGSAVFNKSQLKFVKNEELEQCGGNSFY